MRGGYGWDKGATWICRSSRGWSCNDGDAMQAEKGWQRRRSSNEEGEGSAVKEKCRLDQRMEVESSGSMEEEDGGVA